MAGGSLPRRVTRFIDRRGEIGRLERLLLDDERLVTLAGAAGIGKTRLAIEFARYIGDAFRIGGHDGICFCEVSEAKGVIGLCEHVARALDAPLSAATDTDAVGHVAALMRARGHALIVIDGFEHLVNECAEVIATWVRAAPEVKLIVTSRERLGVFDEVVVDVPPLPHPSGDSAEASPRMPPGTRPSAAERMFMDRARRLTGKNVRADDLPLVRRAVATVDGVPLAIELIAAWTRTMSLREIVTRLDEGGRSLDAGAPGRTGRHATLRVAWMRSWQMLSDTERDALAQCSVFAGSFDVAAAQAVLDLGAHPRARIAGVLRALHDKSLLVAHLESSSGGRFGMYRVTRELGAERLTESRQREATEDRHARYFAAWTVERVAALDGADAREALEELRAGLDDLSAACARDAARARESERSAERACELAIVLSSVLARVGSSASRMAHLDTVLDAIENRTVSAELRARVLLERATARLSAALVDRARGDLERALALVDETAPAALRAALRAAHARTFIFDGAYDAALEGCREAVRIAHEAGARRELGRALSTMATVHVFFGHSDQAAPLIEEALTIQRADRLLSDEMTTLNLFGAVFAVAGDYPRVHACVARQLELYEAVGNEALESAAHSQEAFALHTAGMVEQAEERASLALEKLARLGNARGVSLMEMLRACICLERGALVRARAHADAALRVAGGAAGEECAALLHLAAIDSRLGNVDEARVSLASARASARDRADHEGYDEHAALVEGHLALTAASTARAAGDARRAGELLESARARVEHSRSGPARRWLHVRMAMRALEAALERESASGVRPKRDHDALDGSLRVHTDGGWFVVPEGERVQVRGRAPARRVLRALLEARLSRPGAALALRELVAAVWPGEKLDARLARNRLHVALNTLRHAGLAPWLETVDGGYRLSVGVPVRAVEDAAR